MPLVVTEINETSSTEKDQQMHVAAKAEVGRCSLIIKIKKRALACFNQPKFSTVDTSSNPKAEPTKESPSSVGAD